MAGTCDIEIDGIHLRPVGRGRKGPTRLFGRLMACVDFTPYINSCPISTHFMRLPCSTEPSLTIPSMTCTSDCFLICL